MRRALGLVGGLDAPRDHQQPGQLQPGQQRPDQQRLKVPARSTGRSSDRPSGDRPRQRFVHDGEVPVTIVNRNRHHEADAPAAPTVGRIGVVETALASERAARAVAERSLHEALATVHDLQTKQGHAELAQREASEAARAAHEAAVKALQAEGQEREVQLAEELAAERGARIAAEAALREAVTAREQAEQDLQTALGEPALTQPTLTIEPFTELKVTKRAAAVAQGPAKRTRKAAPKLREPQPVKWWLRTATKR